MDDQEFSRCRKAFVSIIKKENFENDYRYSVRKNWVGPKYGFAESAVQKRWLDFYDGWLAAKQDKNMGVDGENTHNNN